MAEEIAFENGTFTNFQGLKSRDLDLDLGSGHTAYRRASLIDFYPHVKFHRNPRNVCGRTTYGRRDGHL